MLSTGSLDTSIVNFDIRARNPEVSRFNDHQQEVCGLKWSPDGTQLASGGNDNVLCVWDASGPQQPLFKFSQHKAAVKAVAWSPWQRNLLASGGGTKDKTIRFWNTETGSQTGCHETTSQVCQILWNKFEREILSSHGYEKNELSVWKYSHAD